MYVSKSRQYIACWASQGLHACIPTAQCDVQKLARLREVLHFTQQDRPPGRQHFTFEDDDDAADAKATDDTPMPSSAHGELLEHRSALQGSQDAADSLVAQKAAARLQRYMNCMILHDLCCMT